MVTYGGREGQLRRMGLMGTNYYSKIDKQEEFTV